jgi:hypothetical protein
MPNPRLRNPTTNCLKYICAWASFRRYYLLYDRPSVSDISITLIDDYTKHSVTQQTECRYVLPWSRLSTCRYSRVLVTSWRFWTRLILHTIQKYAKTLILGVCNSGPVQKRQETTSRYIQANVRMLCYWLVSMTLELERDMLSISSSSSTSLKVPMGSNARVLAGVSSLPSLELHPDIIKCTM